jgi:hypothetical protein
MKAASAGNTVHGFRASGIWPLNMAEIPDSASNGDTLIECEASSSSVLQNKISAISNAQIDQPGTRIPYYVESSIERWSKPSTSASPGSGRLDMRGNSTSSPALLEKLSPVPTIRTLACSRGRHKKVA